MEHAPLTGVAALADRKVDERRVAIVMAVVGLVLAAGCVGLVEHLLSTANEEPAAAARLRALATDGPAPALPPGHVAVVLIDGLRVDEAERLSSQGRMRRAVLALDAPTLSRPFYHQLLTGVLHDVAGVRTNRFAAHARFDSVADRVRDAGGRVFIVAQGLDWMRRMHGHPDDGGTDAPDAMGAPLDLVIAEWLRTPPPSLLLVHHVAVDRSAHEEGVHGPAHRAALAEVDEIVRRSSVAPADALFVVSDHGHLDAGGHGGPEPEVARSPLLVLAPDVAPDVITTPVSPHRLASTIAQHLGVPRPRTAIGAPLELLATAESSRPRGARPEPAPPDATRPDPWPLRAASVVDAAREQGRLRLAARRRLALPIALLLIILSLGPIKRAFDFDRATPLALAGWPLALVGLHLALGRPLSLSAIDGQVPHTIRVALLGLAAFVLVLAPALLLGRGAWRRRVRRHAATVGWSAASTALAAGAWIGFALGPWPLSPTWFYAPLLIAGAASTALATAAILLAASAPRLSDRGPRAASPPTART